jgi:hypothetical protein
MGTPTRGRKTPTRSRAQPANPRACTGDIRRVVGGRVPGRAGRQEGLSPCPRRPGGGGEAVRLADVPRGLTRQTAGTVVSRGGTTPCCPHPGQATPWPAWSSGASRTALQPRQAKRITGHPSGKGRPLLCLRHHRNVPQGQSQCPEEKGHPPPVRRSSGSRLIPGLLLTHAQGWRAAPHPQERLQPFPLRKLSASLVAREENLSPDRKGAACSRSRLPRAEFAVFAEWSKLSPAFELCEFCE